MSIKKLTQEQIDKLNAEAYKSQIAYSKLLSENSRNANNFASFMMPELNETITNTEKYKENELKKKKDNELRDDITANRFAKLDDKFDEFLRELEERDLKYRETKQKLRDEKNRNKRLLVENVGIPISRVKVLTQNLNPDETPFELKMIDVNEARFPVMDHLNMSVDVLFRLTPWDEEKDVTHITLIRGDSDKPNVSWPLTPDLLQILANDSVECQDVTKQTYLDIFQKSCGKDFADLVDYDDKKDVDLLLKLYKYKKMKHWLVEEYNIPDQQTLYEHDFKKTEEEGQEEEDVKDTSLILKSTKRKLEKRTKENYLKRFEALSEEGKDEFKKYLAEQKEINKDLTDTDAYYNWYDSLPFMEKVKYLKKERYGLKIVISPNDDERLKRLMVLLGSKKSGNTADILPEMTGILDTLLKENKIDKKIYKHFLGKYFHS